MASVFQHCQYNQICSVSSFKTYYMVPAPQGLQTATKHSTACSICPSKERPFLKYNCWAWKICFWTCNDPPVSGYLTETPLVSSTTLCGVDQIGSNPWGWGRTRSQSTPWAPTLHRAASSFHWWHTTWFWKYKLLKLKHEKNSLPLFFLNDKISFFTHCNM